LLRPFPSLHMPLSLTCGVGRVGGVSPVARGGSRRSAPSARAHGGRAAARPLGSEYLSGHKGSLGNVMQVSFKGPCRRAAVTRAGMDDAPMGMDMETALGILGVSESATFDQIVSAKNVALQSAGDDDQVKVQIEQAYDLMLMKSLSQRKSGEVVDSSVRFADVRKSKPVGQQVTALLDKIPGGGLGVETPKKTRWIGARCPSQLQMPAGCLSLSHRQRGLANFAKLCGDLA